MTGRAQSLTILIGVFGLAVSSCGNDDGKKGGAPPEFAYSGDRGPAFWGELSPEWENCSIDPAQSPIDISGAVTDETLEPLSLNLHDTPLDLVNTGTTVTQTYEEGSDLEFEGVTYELEEFHFHTLAEHTFEGEYSRMDLHAFFRNAESGHRAVIGLRYELGAENEFLAQFDDRLPAKQGDEVFDPEVQLNLWDGLTDPSSYFTYVGSTTTPPCSPGVTWILLKEVEEFSEAQFETFRSILGNNFRPLQERNGRIIRQTPW